MTISRRRFLGFVSVGGVAARGRAHAQTSRVFRVGYLGRSPAGIRAFTEGLQEAGHVVGTNLILDVRVPESDTSEIYAGLAAQLVASRADLLFAANPHALEALARATRTIPIVAVDLESDPEARGWVSSVARPGGNVTGFFLDLPEMSGKQLQLLKEVSPPLVRVAVLGDPRVNALQFQAAEAAVRTGGLTVQPVPVTAPGRIPAVVAEAARQRAGALLALSSPMMLANLRSIAEGAVKHRLPSINLFVPFFAEAGGLLAYGPSFRDLFRRAAHYADRILKGARPGELPVQRPSRFDLIVNLVTARALGLQISPSLLLRADRVIE